VPAAVGVTAHGTNRQVQIAEGVGSGIEVASEDRDLGNRQEPGRVGVVAACPLDDLREQVRGGCPAYRLAETGLREGVALDRRGPPVVCAACPLTAFDVPGGFERLHLLAKGVPAEGILGHVAHDDEARSIVRRLTGRLPPGSYLTLSDGANTSKAREQAHQRYAQTGAVPYHLRS
jgi:hypothetical protein